MIYKNDITGEEYSVPWYKDEAIALNIGRYVTSEKCPKCRLYPVARYVDSNECVQCADTQSREDWRLWQQGAPGRPDPFPITLSEAVKTKVNYYYIPRLCNGGHHFIRKHIKTGRCVTCAESIAPKKVSNAVHTLMDNHPEMIVDKESAAVMGMPVFRTGLPCRRGHKGWRYVNGGACLTCMRPKSYPAVCVMRDSIAPPILVDSQPAMFIGYAHSGRSFIGPDGKKLNAIQFDSTFDGYSFMLKDGGRTYRASEAFKRNFTS